MTPDQRLAAARSARADLLGRATLGEGAGVLRAWARCGPVQARQLLSEPHDNSGRHGEASRVVAAVDAAAEPWADPDWSSG
jgi:hypothetical protein